MLFLSLRIGTDYYALPAVDVVEVLPLVNMKAYPQAPRGIAGLLNYRGAPVPVVDLTLLAAGSSSRLSMTTRLALLNYSPEGGASNLLGLIAEEMTDTFYAMDGEFVPTGVDAPEASYLGPVIKRGNKLVQRVEVIQLLSPDLRESLFEPLKG